MSYRLRWSWLALGLLLGISHRLASASSAPLAWSSDGEWISYVVETPMKPEPLQTGWVFDVPVENGLEPAIRPFLDGPTPRVARLWATKIGSKESVLLDETTGTLSPPSWSPDGHSLAFGQITPTTPGRGLFEIILIEGSKRRTLFRQSIEDWGHDTARLARAAVAWSPNGRFIAIPRVGPSGLAIVRTDTAREIKSIEGGMLPVWAPDGGRLLYVSSGDEDRLECLESHFGASRHLADLGQVDGPPIFVRDGLSVVVMTRKRIDRGESPPVEQVDLWRVRLEDGHKDRITTLGTTARDQILAATSLALDRAGENIFSTFTIDGQPSYVTWFRPRERSVHKKFEILDPVLAIEDLSLSPTGATLALRLGGSGARGLPMLCDLDTMQLTPLAPDSATSAAWIGRLSDTLKGLLRELSPIPILAGRAIDRPVALPIPGEIEMQRLRRFGRLGHSLLESSGLDGRYEAAFLFDYVREDYPAALTDLEALDARENEPDRRLRMLNLRAQIFAGMGDFERARGTLGYLKSIETTRRRRFVETTSQGFSISDVPAFDAGWADYAGERLSIIEREAAKESDEGPTVATDHRNPDAPVPGFGLELEPPPPPHRGFPLPPVPEFRPRPRFPAIPIQPLQPDVPPF